ncbi:MAG: chlorohydrolase family protein [Chloroflexota bacterium]|nr:amidohydrolase family protein [Chloroflexia bacterium]MDQ3226759.1 chlorohydrolase family protein [Chloroflexota bacterium]
MTRRRIDASHVIAYQDGGHRYLKDGVVVTEGNEIIHVGSQGSWQEPVEETIDASGMVVTPGFINTHAHLADSPLDKSFVEDMGRRQFYLSGLFEYLPVRSQAMDEEAARAGLAFSMAELLRTGTTTVMEIGFHGEEAVRQAEQVGMRLYMGLGYRSGRWYTDDGKEVKYAWDEESGLRGMERAVRFIEEHDGAQNGRVKGFLSPLQVDTCTEDLLRKSRSAATSMGVPLALHTSQSVNEFQEITRRHGVTPIEWLRDIGFLGPDVILGHAIVVAPGTWSNWSGDDPGILADTGANVAHCVWVFARRGMAMESFARYLARGVNMTLGTDTCPQSMIEGLRYTAVVSKLVDRQTEVATAGDVFTAATLGGAKALGRDDLGRIAPGAKADLLLWKGDSLFMTPLRDPIRNIVYSAAAEDLDTVLIDGEVRMRGREIPGVDLAALTRDLQAAGERMWANVHRGDWAGRSIDELAPQTFPAWLG